MEIIRNGLKDHILKEVEDRKQAVEEVSNRVDQIANNQIPEQYLQQAVDNYVNENNGGFATQDDLNEVKEDLVELSNKRHVTELEWEFNYIDGNSGNNTPNPNYIRTTNYVNFSSGDYVTVNNIINLLIFKYEVNEELTEYAYLGRDIITNDSYYFEEGKFYRFAIGYNPNREQTDITSKENAKFYRIEEKGTTLRCFSVGNIDQNREDLLPTNWFIPLDCVVPKGAKIKSLSIISAISGFRSLQIGLFRELQSTTGGNGFFVCVEKVFYKNNFNEGINTIPLDFEAKCQCYIGIRPMYNDFVSYNRIDDKYGYYSFSNNAWITNYLSNLSYAKGVAEYNRNACVRKNINIFKATYLFKDTPYVGKNIAILGDSIQTNNLYRTPYQWYEILGAELGFTFTTYASGGRAYDPSMGNGTGMAQYVTQMKNHKFEPDAIIVFAGINDYDGEKIPLGDMESESYYSTEYGCMKRAYEVIDSEFPYVPSLIISPVPRAKLRDGVYVNALDMKNAQNYTLQDIVDAEEKLSKAHGFMFKNMTERSNLRPWNGGTNNIMYNGDCLHPNLLGHENIACQLRNSVIELLTANVDNNDYLERPF